MPGIALDFDIDHYLNRFIPRSRLHLLPRPISWLLGYRSSPTPAIGRPLIALWSFIGAVAGISIVEAVFHTEAIRSEGTPIIIASLGAAAILEYNAITSPLAQPRPALISQLLATIIGVGITKLFGLSPHFENLRWLAGALSVGVTSAIMTLTNTVHPPAGATALVAATDPVVAHMGWFLGPVVMLGTVLMLATALVVNNIQRSFPTFWWTPEVLSGREKGADVEKGLESPRGERAGKNLICISASQIVAPECLTLSLEELEILEMLRDRLGGLALSRTRGTDETCIAVPNHENENENAND